MKKCPQCQEEISDGAKRCPKCHADIRPWPAKHPIITAIIAICVLGVVIGIFSGGGKKTKTAAAPTEGATAAPTEGATAAPVETKTTAAPTEGATAAPVEVIKVTAEQLHKEYKENVARFKKNYQNKKVEVSGTFSKLRENVITKENIVVFEPIFGPECYPKNSDDFLDFNKGNSITVIGIVEAGVMTPEIKQCELKKQ